MAAPFRLRRLGRGDLPAVTRHLLALDATDRASRFRTALGDAAVEAYARALDPGRVILVGAFAPDGALAGLAEAHLDAADAVEIAVSVGALSRGRGLAKALVARAVELAGARGAVTAELFFVPGHAAVARLARSLGGSADCCRGEARISLPRSRALATIRPERSGTDRPLPS
jgi:GNAT superfamily N-acetyltransferase